jgi:hypothetical protein
VLFEETQAMTLVRLLAGAMHDHPVIVARKVRATDAKGADYLARIEIIEAARRVSAGDGLPLVVRITNAGGNSWVVGPNERSGIVRLGVQLLDADRRLINRDYHRVSFDRPVAPGEHRDVRFSCPAPTEAGVWHLKADLVLESVTWFEPKGSGVATHRLEVDARA